MTLENKKAVAVINNINIENLCRACAYRGCTNCPSLVPMKGRNEKVEDFPQVTKGIELKNGKIIVLSCRDYLKALKEEEKIKVQKPKVVFNRKTRKNEFVR